MLYCAITVFYQIILLFYDGKRRYPLSSVFVTKYHKELCIVLFTAVGK